MTFRVAPFAVCLACCGVFESSALPSGETYLPHVANGSFGDASFRTTFILFNYGDENGSVRLRPTRDDC